LRYFAYKILYFYLESYCCTSSSILVLLVTLISLFNELSDDHPRCYVREELEPYIIFVPPFKTTKKPMQTLHKRPTNARAERGESEPNSERLLNCFIFRETRTVSCPRHMTQSYCMSLKFLSCYPPTHYTHADSRERDKKAIATQLTATLH